MTVALLTPEQAELAARVDALDLEPIAFKLMHPEFGQTVMELAEADQLIASYRGFLKLCAWYRSERIVPSESIDRVWHTHVLDTAKYEFDCKEVFGFFLHHFPYFGLRGADDEREWRAAYARTKDLFRYHFGIELTGRAGAECHEDGESCAGENLCTEGSCDRSVEGQVRPRPDRSAVLS